MRYVKQQNLLKNVTYQLATLIDLCATLRAAFARNHPDSLAPCKAVGAPPARNLSAVSFAMSLVAEHCWSWSSCRRDTHRHCLHRLVDVRELVDIVEVCVMGEHERQLFDAKAFQNGLTMNA